MTLSELVFREMLILGSLLNLVTTVAALLVFAADVPVWLGWCVFLLPLPYNVFLFASTWRAGERRGKIAGNAACIAATLWLIGVTLL